MDVANLLVRSTSREVVLRGVTPETVKAVVVPSLSLKVKISRVFRFVAERVSFDGLSTNIWLLPNVELPRPERGSGVGVGVKVGVGGIGVGVLVGVGEGRGVGVGVRVGVGEDVGPTAGVGVGVGVGGKGVGVGVDPENKTITSTESEAVFVGSLELAPG